MYLFYEMQYLQPGPPSFWLLSTLTLSVVCSVGTGKDLCTGPSNHGVVVYLAQVQK